MLVLSRKKNEELTIGGVPGSEFPLITIVIIEIRGDKVRLGVEGPKEIPVHRREVYEAIKRQIENRDFQIASPTPLPVTDGRTG